MPKNSLKNKAPKPLQAAIIRLALFAPLLYVWVLIVRTNNVETLLGKVVWLAVVTVALSIFFIVLGSTIAFLYRQKRKLSRNHVDNFTIGIHKVTGVAFWLTLILILTDALFVDVFELLTSLTIIAAFIGIVFKDHIINFVNGIMIMFTGKFRLGEFVKIGEYKGKIVDLTFTHTELQTDTRDLVYVPNNIIFAKEAINYSRNPIKNILMDITVDKAYYPHYNALYNAIITQVLKQFPDTIDSKEHIRIRVESVQKDSVTWTIELVTTRYNFILEKNLRNAIAETVAKFISALEKKK
jgi:small-conductance mechanosensitive channel